MRRYPIAPVPPAVALEPIAHATWALVFGVGFGHVLELRPVPAALVAAGFVFVALAVAPPSRP